MAVHLCAHGTAQCVVDKFGQNSLLYVSEDFLGKVRDLLRLERTTLECVCVLLPFIYMRTFPVQFAGNACSREICDTMRSSQYHTKGSPMSWHDSRFYTSFEFSHVMKFIQK